MSLQLADRRSSKALRLDNGIHHELASSLPKSINRYFEVHGCSRLEISEFEKTGGHVGIVIEKSEEGIFELWEFGWIWVSSIVLHVIIEQMDGFWFE